MAKAKTPGAGGDKPTQTSTSRASSAASRSKGPESKGPASKGPDEISGKPSDTTPANPKTDKTTAASTETDTSAKAAPTSSAAAKAPDDVKTSVAPDAKKDVSAPSGPPKPDSAKPDSEAKSKPAVTAETKAKVEKDDAGSATAKDTDTKTDAVRNTPTDTPNARKSDPAPATSAPDKTPVPEPEKRRSVFFPMLLGGVVAGGIGYVAAELDLFGMRSSPEVEQTLASDLAAQDARITELEQIALAPDTSEPVFDPAASEAAINDIKASVADLSARLDEIANRPAPAPGEAPQIDTSAFEAELATLKSSVEAQRNEIEQLLATAQSVEEATAQAAKTATAQTILARIVSAIDTGQPFATDLSDLQANGVQDIPQALSDAAETGVATSASLQDRFPDAARAALAQAPAPDGGGIGSFLKRQLGARSVAPREGDDPDAILSRAEAAVLDGRLDDALTEIDALPDAAKAPMSDWIADARARQSAQEALATLTQRLTAD